MLYKLFTILLSFFSLIACNTNTNKSANTVTIQGMAVSFPDTSQVHQLDGQALAIAYCQACHAFPEPALLPKSVWQKHVLPNMALRLGIGEKDPYTELSNEEIQHIVTNNVYPTKPLISQAAWDKIVNYYITQAPEEPLPPDTTTVVNNNLPGFIEWFPILATAQTPLTTLIKYDTANRLLYMGDRRSKLYTFDHRLQIIDSLQLSSPPAYMAIEQEQKLLVTMGIMDPSDEYKGQLWINNQTEKKFTPVLSQLPRPVYVSAADLNADNSLDYVISGFGNETGRLSWFERDKDGKLLEHVLKPVAGALQTNVQDFNHDGLPDIMALMAQGREQISIFYNQGKNTFEERMLLRFQPVHGSSYFELADFNQDGAPDILYTNGDNADYSISLKKFHGVRIFLNDGAYNFTEAWFFPMYGASKAIARDFDQDGDLDIAAISFFPDFTARPDKSIMYFESTGKLNFSAYSPSTASLGHWLVMDAGDVDRDGDEDLILGSFTYTPSPVPQHLLKQWSSGPPFIVLRNNMVGNTKAYSRQ